MAFIQVLPLNLSIRTPMRSTDANSLGWTDYTELTQKITLIIK
jgi:hypothetical protein